MNNKLSIIALGLMGSLGLMAAPLTPQQALQRASADGPQKAAAKQFNLVPALTVMTDTQSPAAYVFTGADGVGFQILAGDDMAFPVLAYSENGVFDSENIPTQLKWWLNEYARQIQWAATKNITSAGKIPANPDWEAVEPLVKSKWDQDAPYNNDCPTPKNSDQHCYTGCVATSMAQVMNYHKYPERGEGTIKYRASKIGRTLMLNFASKAFDWDNMLDTYTPGSYNDEQAAAVAYLMKACGYSVEMSYGTDASGASGSSIGESLRKYFKYDDACRSESRDLYSMSEWSQMIYDNLENVGPVIINGRDFDGTEGHSFICDGYDGKGYFHFNWGWSGISDGYYSLDALNPDAMGIGGYGGGFNHGQNAIFGIQPPTGEPYTPVNNIIQYGNMIATVSGSSIEIGTADWNPSGWGNPTDHDISGKIAIKYILENGDFSTVAPLTLGGSQNFSLAPGSYYSYPRVSLTGNIPSLPDGTYTATLVFADNDTDNWQAALAPWGCSNFVYITKSGSSYTVTRPAVKELTIPAANIETPLYNGRNTLMKVTLVNNTDVELTQAVLPRLYQGSRLCMQGSGLLVTVPANSTVDEEIVSRFAAANGYTFSGEQEFKFVLYNPVLNENYGEFGNVTMKPAPSRNSIIGTNFTIEDAELESIVSDNATLQVYSLENTDSFMVDLDYMVRFGFFDGTIRLSICRQDPVNQITLIPVVDDVYSVMPFLSAGETGHINAEVNFPDAESGTIYAVRAQYSESSSWKNLMSVYFAIGLSAVDGIEADESKAQATYYNLQGMLVSSPEKGQLVIRRMGDKTEKIIF